MRTRRRRCRICGELFESDRRLKERQYACSKTACQQSRQSKNVNDWYQNNPDCLKYRQGLTRQWFRGRPRYSRRRRSKNPDLTLQNRLETKRRMRVLRDRRMFDKTKSIVTQVVGNQADKCLLNSRGWVHMRLTKQSRLKRIPRICQNLRQRLSRTQMNFKGRMYDLSGLFKPEKEHERVG